MTGTDASVLHLPPAGWGPGVLLLPEFWGLNGQVLGVARSLAGAGFVVLAVDLYDGAVAGARVDAYRLSSELSVDHAADCIERAVDRLIGDERVVPADLGVVGFCLGGGLALYASTLRPEIKACVAFYGLLPTEDHPIHPDWSRVKAAVLGHIAEHDEYATVAHAEAVAAALDAVRVDHRFELYAGCQHAFCNETQPDRYDAAAASLAWQRTVEFLDGRLAAAPSVAP